MSKKVKEPRLCSVCSVNCVFFLVLNIVVRISRLIVFHGCPQNDLNCVKLCPHVAMTVITGVISHIIHSV